MNRVLFFTNLALAIVLVVLWRVEVALESGREAVRRADSAFHALAGPGGPEAKDIGRIDFTLPGAETRWGYARRPEGWRIPQYREAFATGSAIDGILRAFLESRGTAIGRMPADAEHFGIVPGKTFAVDFQDAAGKSLLRAVAGSVAPGQRSGECFATAGENGAILHLNANPWPYAGEWTPRDRFPPLTDRRVTAQALGRGLPAKVTFAGEEPPAVRELIRREIPLEQRLPMGDRGPRFEWFGTTAEGEKRLNDEAAFAYVHAVTSLEYEDLLGPRAPHEAVFARPANAIVLEYDGGTKDTLTLGTPAANGLHHLHNSAADQVFLIAAAGAAALTPDVAALLQPPRPRPAPPPGQGLPQVPGVPQPPGVPPVPGGQPPPGVPPGPGPR
jgi:hypothetical protein